MWCEVVLSQMDYEILVQFDVLFKECGLSVVELFKWMGIIEVNLLKFKNGRVMVVWFFMLMVFCWELDCQIGDLLVFVLVGKEQGFLV